jgi:hypothetical protein
LKKPSARQLDDNSPSWPKATAAGPRVSPVPGPAAGLSNGVPGHMDHVLVDIDDMTSPENMTPIEALEFLQSLALEIESRISEVRDRLLNEDDPK